MRFMLLVEANEKPHAGAMPCAGRVVALGRFNEAMRRAGLPLARQREALAAGSRS